MRRALALGLMLLSMAGCASLGYQSSTISLPRAAVADALIDLAYQHARVEQRAIDLCATKAVPAEVCQQGAQYNTALKAQFAAVRAALRDPGKTVDLETVMRLLPQIAQLAGTFGLRLAPLASGAL